MVEVNIFDLDLYELLGLSITCTPQEIKKAYRKKALTCHPDKNPDNPKAVQLFQQLLKALEILTDDSARAAYNKVLTGRKAAKIRHRELDSKRQKLKEDLEKREKAALNTKKTFDTRTDEEKLQAEIDRLRKEGSKEVEEEKAFIRRQVEEERKSGRFYVNPTPTEDHSSRLKLRWRSSKDDPENGGYNYENLYKILSKHGDIAALIISKKLGSAMVEFKTSSAASMALQFEKGFKDNTLTLECIGDSQPKKQSVPDASAFNLASENDFENLVFRRMRQAQERQKLLDEIAKEDG